MSKCHRRFQHPVRFLFAAFNSSLALNFWWHFAWSAVNCPRGKSLPVQKVLEGAKACESFSLKQDLDIGWFDSTGKLLEVAPLRKNDSKAKHTVMHFHWFPIPCGLAESVEQSKRSCVNNGLSLLSCHQKKTLLISSSTRDPDMTCEVTWSKSSGIAYGLEVPRAVDSCGILKNSMMPLSSFVILFCGVCSVTVPILDSCPAGSSRLLCLPWYCFEQSLARLVAALDAFKPKRKRQTLRGTAFRICKLAGGKRGLPGASS